MKGNTKGARKAATTGPVTPGPTSQELAVKIEARGPDQATITAASRVALEHPSVRKLLGNARHRLVDFRLVESEAQTKGSRLPPPPIRYSASIYDYTNYRTLIVQGQLNNPKVVEVSESGSQPLPSNEEFEEAVKLLRSRELEVAYREAGAEFDQAWDTTASDGLADETW